MGILVLRKNRKRTRAQNARSAMRAAPETGQKKIKKEKQPCRDSRYLFAVYEQPPRTPSDKPSTRLRVGTKSPGAGRPSVGTFRLSLTLCPSPRFHSREGRAGRCERLLPANSGRISIQGLVLSPLRHFHGGIGFGSLHNPTRLRLAHRCILSNSSCCSLGK